MKQCPYCGSDLPNDKEIFCVKCSHIIDDDFLLEKKSKRTGINESDQKRKQRVKRIIHNHLYPTNVK